MSMGYPMSTITNAMVSSWERIYTSSDMRVYVHTIIPGSIIQSPCRVIYSYDVDDNDEISSSVQSPYCSSKNDFQYKYWIALALTEPSQNNGTDIILLSVTLFSSNEVTVQQTLTKFVDVFSFVIFVFILISLFKNDIISYSSPNVNGG